MIKTLINDINIVNNIKDKLYIIIITIIIMVTIIMIKAELVTK